MFDDHRETAAGALPPQRDDEPGGLREEILDELSDHFACAYRRELLRTRGNKDLSRRNVLSRFGDPAYIARRLYFDAMKGKLMAQKLMVLFTCCCAILMAVVAFMGWRLVEANHEAQAAFIAQSQEMQAAILARLDGRTGSEEPAWEDSLEWSEFELKFVEAGTGEPVTGVAVGVVTGRGEGAEQIYFDLHPNENGIITLAPMHIGSYSLSFQMPWGASASDQIRIRPGHDFHKTYRVPTKPETGKVDIDIEWPKRFQGRDLWAILYVWQENSLRIDKLSWLARTPRFFAIHTDGRVVDLGEFYKGQVPPYAITGFGFPQSVRSAFRVAAQKVESFYEPGLDDVMKGTWASKLLGIYHEPTLPSDWSAVVENPVWIRVQQGYVELKNNWHATSIGPSMEKASVRPDGALIRGGGIYSYPGPGKLTITPNTINQWTITIPEVVGEAIPEEMLPPRTPVTAPKVPSYGGENSAMTAPATVTIRCVDNSKRARAVEGTMVTLQWQGDGPWMPTYRPDDAGEYELPPTDAQGISHMEGIAPGTYNLAIRTPAGALQLTDEFQITANENVERTIVCPAPWPRKAVALSISWPGVAKRHDDLWLVMEVKETLEQRTKELGDWPTYGRYLFAINPDGRTVVWTADAAGSGQTLFEILQWPMSDEVKYFSSMARKHDDPNWRHSVSEKPQVEMYPYYSSTHRVIGVGIARWEGRGSPDEILRNLRDGRYLAGTLGGRAEYSTRGAFFQIFRKLVPMQSSEGLPILAIRPSANTYSSPEKSEATPTLYYTVPEPLVASALERWDGLAVVGN